MITVLTLQVFDSPHLKVMVGKKVRKRLDVKSIVQLIHSFDVPLGMTIFLKMIVLFKLSSYYLLWL